MNQSFTNQDLNIPITINNMTQDEYDDIIQDRRNGEFTDIEDGEYVAPEEIIRLILNSGMLSEKSLQEIAQAGIISYSPADGTISYPPAE